MSTITKEFTKEQLIEQAKKNIEVLRGAVEKIPGASDAAVIHLKLAEITLASLEAEKEYKHHSVIAEQLAHVLSNMDATDHQRAVISCAVDRLNKVSQLLQASPSALLVPEVLDYQGAKELYNYLMTEEETNATVNGWNACRAAMLQGADGNSPAIPDGWVIVPVEPTEDMIVNGFESEPDESFSDEREWEAYDAMSGCQQAAHRAKLCWAAMIAASPAYKKVNRQG